MFDFSGYPLSGKCKFRLNIRLNDGENVVDIANHPPAKLFSLMNTTRVPSITSPSSDEVVARELTNPALLKNGTSPVPELSPPINLPQADSGRAPQVSTTQKSREDVEAVLPHERMLHRAIISYASEGIVVFDTEQRYIVWNAFMEELTGIPTGAVLGRKAGEILPDHDLSRVLECIRGALAGHEKQLHVFPFHSEHKGEEVQLSARYAPLRNQEQEIVGAIGIVSDISEQYRAEEQLRRSNAILTATQEASTEGICLVDDAGEVVRYNRRFSELWEIETSNADTYKVMNRVLEAMREPDEFIDRINHLYDHPHKSVHDEIYLCDGRIFDRYSAPAMTPDGVSYGRVWSFSDITERKAAQQRLEHQAFHDALTNLPNRALFMERLQHALTRSHRHNSLLAVLFLDLDRFKIINDSLGHECGDRLLIQVSQRLRECLRSQDTAARLGGDEFVLLVEDIHEIGEATRIAERIAEALSTPFDVGDQEVFTSTSIGIAANMTGSETPDDLLRDADAAMYRAKGRGRASYEIFDRAMNLQAMENLRLDTDLRHALNHNQFELHYQPLINLTTGCAAGIEALVRWRHPTRGLVTPNAFIPLAEDTGLILPLGHWVLREACRVARLWQDRFPDQNRTLSINISARQFAQPNLVRDIQRVLDETGLEPRRLVVEITESVLMEDAQSTTATLRALKDLGVDIAVDDFGTGYSSLSYLRRFPVSTLKIDRSFVLGIISCSEDLAIVRAVITLAKSLSLNVVAEGVETAEQRDCLLELGCERAQGFLFSKPLTLSQLEEQWDTLSVQKPVPLKIAR